MRQSNTRFAAIFLMLALSFSYAVSSTGLPISIVQVGEHRLEVEYASTAELRSQGLMFRKTLCKQCGMLFKFSRSKYASMWMKNTYIPLDVAFITEQGVITDIKPMTPHDLSPVSASRPVLYALEMNQGWFAQHGVKVGDKLVFISDQEAD